MFIPNIALYIKPFWGNKILSGEKTWEIRGNSTKKREKIGVLYSGSKGFLSGYVELYDCFQISEDDLLNNIDKHCIIDYTHIHYKKKYAWLLKNPVIYDKPVQIFPKKGAIIWTKINL